MEDRQMKVGIWFYGLGTALSGILNIAWGDLDASHQPLKSLGMSLLAQHIMAYVAGAWLAAAGLAALWRRSAKIGAAAAGTAYLIFAVLWLARYYEGVHAFGWKINVLLGVTFGLAQQLMLIAPVALVFASAAPQDSLLQKRAVTAARWMLGLPPVIFGIFHVIGVRVFASIVPHWMSFGYFWAGLTGIAFFLSGCAICVGITDILAARLLALMLMLFEGFVEIPPIYSRLHNEATWGAAVYNVTAIGACWMFAEFLASRANRRHLRRVLV
jgi:hypothetical protein